MQISDISQFIQNLSERKKQIIIGSSSVMAGVALLIGYFTTGPDALSYAKAEDAFAKWRDSPTDDGLYRGMMQAMSQVPALGEKYEAEIAQKLIDTNKLEDALVMANRSLSRVKDEAPFHTSFAENTFLIEQGSFQKALEMAVALKESMGRSYLDQYKGGSLLYAHNLLRIAFLQQELKNRPGEKAAWEELEELLDAKTPLAELVLASFSEKKINLSQYITERKKAL
jgi:hypothetical protein